MQYCSYLTVCTILKKWQYNSLHLVHGRLTTEMLEVSLVICLTLQLCSQPFFTFVSEFIQYFYVGLDIQFKIENHISAK